MSSNIKRDREPYSSKIIKAGALIEDTKSLLLLWDPQLSVDENVRRLNEENLLGKPSRSRVSDVLPILRQRYLSEESVARALSSLAKSGRNGSILEKILYFHTVRADPLLRDLVIEVLGPKSASGVTNVEVQEIEVVLRRWVEEGKTSGTWGDSTILRIAQGVLSTLRDFGVLRGTVRKHIASAYMPLRAFCYIAFYLKQHEPSGNRLLELQDWRLFFFSKEGVERLFLEAHQHGLLEYQVAGSVIRLTFPAKTLEEYVHALTK